MSELPKEGTYTGTVVSASADEDPYNDGALVLRWDVDIPDHTVTCRHSTGGDWPEIAKDIIEKVFDLPWPQGIERLQSTVGQEVQVKVKHKEKNGRTYANCYIVTPRQRDKPADAVAIKRAVALLGGGDDPDETPF